MARTAKSWVRWKHNETEIDFGGFTHSGMGVSAFVEENALRVGARFGAWLYKIKV